MDAQRLSDSILKLNSSRCSVYWHTHTCCTRTAVAILTPAEVVRCSKDGKVTEAAREAERAAVRSNLAALWHSETSQPSGEQASVHDLGVSAERVRRGEGKDVTPSHSHQPLPRQEMQEPSRCSVSWCAQFPCCPSTKAQKLTAEKQEAVTLADSRAHTLGRCDQAARACNVAL
jgi:hypothetical protein